MKDNNLIGIFMGGEIISEEKYEMPHGSHSEGIIYNWKIPKGIPSGFSGAKIGLFNYHSDWNWLMPVIEQIENMIIYDDFFKWKYRFIIHKNECEIQKFGTRLIQEGFYQWDTFVKVNGANKIKATYDCIVLFINKINEINKDE